MLYQAQVSILFGIHWAHVRRYRRKSDKQRIAEAFQVEVGLDGERTFTQIDDGRRIAGQARPLIERTAHSTGFTLSLHRFDGCPGLILPSSSNQPQISSCRTPQR